MENTVKELCTEREVAQMVHDFYADVRRDAVLGGYRNHLVRAWQALESELDPDHESDPAPAPMPVLLDEDLNLIRNDELEVQLAVQHLADVLVR